MAAMRMKFSALKKRYPLAVAQVEIKLRNGKSALKNAPLESLEWGFNWCVAITSGVYSIKDILSGEAQKNQKIEDKMTVDEKVKDEMLRTSVTVFASKGRGYWSSGILLSPPKELEKLIRKGHEDRAKEQKRFDALSKEAQDQETQELLKKLRFGKPGGLMGFSL